MGNWFGEWPRATIQAFMNWLDGIFAQILQALNPIYLVIAAADLLATMLPDGDGAQLQALALQMQGAVTTAMGYVNFLGYFFNLEFLFLCLSLMMLTETMLLILRFWRTVRSLLT